MESLKKGCLESTALWPRGRRRRHQDRPRLPIASHALELWSNWRAFWALAFRKVTSQPNTSIATPGQGFHHLVTSPHFLLHILAAQVPGLSPGSLSC